MRPDLFQIPGTSFTVPGYGFAILVAFLVGTWWMTRRAAKVKADPDIVLSLALIGLIVGGVGARLFYVIHYWQEQFANQPAQILNISSGGFEVYGGVLPAIIVGLLYLWRKGVSMRLYLDLGAPSLMFGMGVGRIGCFLAGCCWGATCPAHLPWAVTFPPAATPTQRQWQDRLVSFPADLLIIESTGIAVPAPRQVVNLKPEDLDRLREKQAKLPDAIAEAQAEGNETRLRQAEAMQAGLGIILGHLEHTPPAQMQALLQRPEFRSVPIHPTQLYAAIGPLLMAALTSAWFYRRRRHGTVMLLALSLYAVQRFIEEYIRADNPRDTFGLTVSQGVSIALLCGMGLWYAILRQMPLRSPRPAFAVKKTKDTPAEPADQETPATP
jgi:phosphatidylglycerol---prolipoprotein diacylglyceryl transferase